VLIVGNRTFAKTDTKAPGTLKGLVRWFEKKHPEEATRINAAPHLDATAPVDSLSANLDDRDDKADG